MYMKIPPPCHFVNCTKMGDRIGFDGRQTDSIMICATVCRINCGIMYPEVVR